ncbi:I78 family peptidase inhibitor [Paracandidimonas soli]|uniref:I78 family peptidase inhibitor n=1 Tax=Paracandidimonas soli TaxID=1917182 RepID=UPI0033426862
MKRLLAVLPVVLLAACQSPAGSQDPEKQADTCGYSTRQTLVGLPAAEINESSLPPGTRILHPNTAATMDYRLERLNIRVNADGIVESVSCG